MKLTKKILREHGFYSPFYIANKLGNEIFVDYIPATNERLNSHYAYWKCTHFEGMRTLHADFTIYNRQDKQPVLNKVIAVLKKKYNIDITDKDPFGGYHPKGTLDKLQKLIESENKE